MARITSAIERKSCIAAGKPVIELAGRSLAMLLRFISKTWRVEGRESVLCAIEEHRGTPLLIAFWHGAYIPLFSLMSGPKVKVFIREGARGRLITIICQRFGFIPVLLPRADHELALERISSALASGVPCAVAIDGPIGPPHRAKPTMLRLAAASGASVLPVSIGVKPRLVLGWRWDRRELAFPFARIVLRAGEPIELPFPLPDEEVLIWARRVEAALDGLDLGLE